MGQLECMSSAKRTFQSIFFLILAFQVALAVRNLPANAGDTRDAGSIPGLGRSPGRGNGNPFQYSCWENSTNRGTWRATVHGIAKSQTRLKTRTHRHRLMAVPSYFNVSKGRKHLTVNTDV